MGRIMGVGWATVWQAAVSASDLDHLPTLLHLSVDLGGIMEDGWIGVWHRYMVVPALYISCKDSIEW